MTYRAIILAIIVIVSSGPAREAAAQGDQVTWGVHITLAPTWLDPAESSGIITPYMICLLYTSDAADDYSV